MHRNKVSGLYELTLEELRMLIDCAAALQGAIYIFEPLVCTRAQRDQMRYMERAYNRTKQYNLEL